MTTFTADLDPDHSGETVICWNITEMNQHSIIRLVPGLWVQECGECGDGITGMDVGAVNSNMSVHVTRQHGIVFADDETSGGAAN